MESKKSVTLFKKKEKKHSVREKVGSRRSSRLEKTLIKGAEKKREISTMEEIRVWEEHSSHLEKK